MAESKFAGVFDKLKGQPEQLAPEPERSAPPTFGRPRGKRSDPEYKQFSVLLKKVTHKQASRLLEDTDRGQDVSELVQELLEGWINAHAK
jgi:hypothetical protein